MKHDYNKVKKLHIVTLNSPNHILKAQFLLMRMASDKDCRAHIEAEMERYNAPAYTVSISLSKDDLATEVGKKTMELARQLIESDNAKVNELRSV
jgi:hypothetical protein